MILARHTALNATATIIAAAGRLAITTLMARRLGPDAFGAVVFAQWCAETIAAVASLGLPNVLARYCPELALASVADRRLRIRQMALAAAATLLLATVASVAIFTWLDGGKGAAAVAAPAAWCLAALAASLGSALGAGLLRFDLILASNAAFVSVGAAAVMTMTRPGEPQGAMLVWTAASLAAVATMVGGLALTRRASVAVGEQGLAPARELRSYAVNTWIGGLAATQLWTRGEVGVVRAFAPPAELARYGAATTLSALVMQGVNLFQGGMTPHLAKAWSQGDRDRIERLVRGLSGVTFAAALCGSLFVVLFAREIVAGLFGGRFEGAAPALILVSLGTTAAGAGTAETRLMDTLKASDELLNKRGVKHVIFKSELTAHEWHTWRRHLNDFAPRLFQ